MRDKILLRQLQALPLDAKVLMSQQRIREWYNHFEGKVVISYSGGKDSTVLAHLVHQMYPDVPMVFANTGLEYPEIQAFARKMGAEFVRPKMSFSEVISKYGYPIIGKEVAEAIHFARRIVLIGGGIQRNEIQANRDSRTTNRRKRTELEGQRENELLTAPPRRNCTDGQDGGGRTSQTELHRRSGAETPDSQGRTAWNSKVKDRATNLIPPPPKRILRKIKRARKQLMG